MTAVHLSVMIAVRRSGMTVVGTAVMSGVRRVGMTGVRRGLGIRVDRGLRLLVMDGLLGSRVALGPGRGVMTGPGLCRVAMSGPDIRARRLSGMIVGRVGMTGLDRVGKSVAAGGGTTASVVVVASGVMTRRGSVRARTTRSFPSGSPVRSLTVG
jgi:hypothetical protein